MTSSAPRTAAAAERAKPPEKPKNIQEFRELLGKSRSPGKPAGSERPAPEPERDEAASPLLTQLERGGPDAGGEQSQQGDGALESEPYETPLGPSELACDPLGRALAHALPRPPAPVEVAPVPLATLPDIEQLLGRLVRRAAFGGDGRKGSARLEIGAGVLAGATLLVSADAGELSIDLELPPGAAADEWRDRLATRLSARGLAVRELNVR